MIFISNLINHQNHLTLDVVSIYDLTAYIIEKSHDEIKIHI